MRKIKNRAGIRPGIVSGTDSAKKKREEITSPRLQP